MTDRNKHIKVLKRRLSYLKELLKNSDRSDLSYTKAEIASLKDALECMEFVQSGFGELLTDKELNLTIEQIGLATLMKGVMTNGKE